MMPFNRRFLLRPVPTGDVASGIVPQVKRVLIRRTDVVVECPRCGLVSFESAERCDCGYRFHSATVDESYSDLTSSEGAAQAERDRQVFLGRQLILAVIMATLAVSVFSMIHFNIVIGPYRLPQQIARLILNIILAVFLYRGANWARWIAGTSFSIAGLGSLLFLGTVGPRRVGMMDIYLLAIGAILLASGIILLFVPSVRAYFSAKKGGAA